MTALADGSVDRVLAIECAPHFDRARFYAEAARVLPPGGRLVLADLALTGRLAALAAGGPPDLQRMGDTRSNRALWERHFITRQVRNINRHTLPGCQRTVIRVLKTLPRVADRAHRQHWGKLAATSQIMALGLLLGLIRYDLIVLERP
jgi:hypothetical protein